MQCIALMLRLSHGDGSNGKFKRKSPTISIVVIGNPLFRCRSDIEKSMSLGSTFGSIRFRKLFSIV